MSHVVEKSGSYGLLMGINLVFCTNYGNSDASVYE